MVWFHAPPLPTRTGDGVTTSNDQADDGLAEAAKRYTSRRWHIFPIRHGEKTPAVKDWPTAATTNPAQVDRWWPTGRGNPRGVAIATGPSNLVVIDCDLATNEEGRHISGIHNLADLQADYSLIGPTYAVETPSGGRHYYFTAPPDTTIRNSASRLAEGVDIRAAGGYVVAPPTTTTAGTYIVTNPAEPRPLPDWISDLLAIPTSSPSPPERVLEIPTWRIDPYIAAALRGEIQRVQTARTGQRNHTLYRAANNLGQLIGAGLIDHHHVDTALTDAYQTHIANGADTPEQTAETIRSGIEAGRRHPRAITRTTSGPRSAASNGLPAPRRQGTGTRTPGDRGPPRTRRHPQPARLPRPQR